MIYFKLLQFSSDVYDKCETPLQPAYRECFIFICEEKGGVWMDKHNAICI